MKGQTWLEVLGRMRKEESFKDQMLDPVAEEMDRIPPNPFEQVIRFVQSKGEFAQSLAFTADSRGRRCGGLVAAAGNTSQPSSPSMPTVRLPPRLHNLTS